MTNILKHFLVLLFIVSLSLSAEAQFIKKIQNAANRGIEKAIEKKVEDEASKMTEKQIEKIFSDMYGDNEDGTPGGLDMSKIMKGMGEPVDTESQYDFFGYMVMEMTSTDEKGKTADPVHLKSFMAKSADYTGMEIIDPKKPEAMMAMVFDMKNQASIVFLDSEGKKTSFAYKMDMDAVDEAVDKQMEEQMEEQINIDDVSIEKTGKTKEILGYDCEEYHVKNEDGEGYYWITEEPIGGFTSFWSSNSPMMSSKTQEKYAQRLKNMPKGNFMELTYTTEESGTVVMKVVEINESAAKSLTMADYPNIMNSMEQK